MVIDEAADFYEIGYFDDNDGCPNGQEVGAGIGGDGEVGEGIVGPDCGLFLAAVEILYD